MVKSNLAEPHSEGFRADLLSLRRRMLGLSQSDLAERAGMTQASLSRIEQGLKEVVSEELVGRLATALTCETTFFHQPEREYGAPMSAHPMYRKRASVGLKVLDKAIAEWNVRIAHARTLLREIDFEPELVLPNYDIDDYQGDAVQVAALVRRAWYLPAGPVKNLMECLERAGCVVSMCDMANAKIDAATYQVPGMPPMIFVNDALPGDRLRFTLAHELGHLVMHRYPTPDMERQADSFASAFLMPAEDIGPELDGLTLAKASYMKPVWKVSIASLIYRAGELGRIDESKTQWLWRTLSAKGWRLREPTSVDIAQEKPTLLNALIEHATEIAGNSPNDLARMLHLSYAEIESLYKLPPQRTVLRRIK